MGRQPNNKNRIPGVMKLMDEIEAVERDHSVTAADIRDAVDAAIEAAHAEHGVVHIGLMRPHPPAWATGPQLGARITGHVRRKSLVWTGRVAKNGNTKTRNAMRLAKVYR